MIHQDDHTLDIAFSYISSKPELYRRSFITLDLTNRLYKWYKF